MLLAVGELLQDGEMSLLDVQLNLCYLFEQRAEGSLRSIVIINGSSKSL